ncbi:hypothetical protein HYQ45_007780 [Verticillium longisporum]|uniref:Luciferase domain-containing protein n=1 Tax=Verticillium longisporum TaxID=100787 RepID=A0A0G4LYM1_VERLO|nr:hypothetical protein HYQ45_007780 [Verticillium longisporum]CRK27094.1 hypothetical protein BN1708_004316 [Verticillium longisporum]
MSLDPCPTTQLHELHHDHDAHATSLPTPNSEALAVERELDMDSLAVACIVAQKPVSVTLDGPTICALTVFLVCLVHCVDTPLAECLIASVPLLLLIHNDYNNFLGLGPGGTPPTFQGYARIAWLRLWALRDPFTPPDPDPTPGRLPTRGRLLAGSNSPPRRSNSVHGGSSSNTNVDTLPYRPGPRPVVAGIAPQRQLDQHGAKPQYRALRRTLEHLAARRPGRFGTARSCLEKHGLGLFARHPVNVTCNGEVCHVHDSDHSLHMTLHPDDIAEVLRKGWGQRHPLARKGWFGAMPVPEEFLMVYAPRDDQELQIVCRIIEAAIWYVTAESEQIEVLYRSRTPSIASSK